jgi:nicotinamidase-related amidase
MKSALILIDIQNDYFPNGAMKLEESEEAGRRAGEILTVFRQKNLPIVHIQHLSLHPGATFFLPGTEGVRFHETVRPLPEETIIEKHYPNSFRETGLLDHLQNLQITRLTIVGMMTHLCVDATVRAAFDCGFACTVLHDACATRSLSFGGRQIPAAQVHGAFMAALGTLYARIMSVEGAVTKWRSE